MTHCNPSQPKTVRTIPKMLIFGLIFMVPITPLMAQTLATSVPKLVPFVPVDTSELVSQTTSGSHSPFSLWRATFRDHFAKRNV